MKLRYVFFPSLFLLPMLAFADDTLPVDQFLSMVLDTIKNLGGLPWVAKVAAIVTLVIALTKVSVLQPLWDKLGWFKVWVAPTLAAIGGVVAMAATGTLTFSGVVAYFFAGAGSVILHQILDAIKDIPTLGDNYKAMITFFEGLLGSPKSGT